MSHPSRIDAQAEARTRDWLAALERPAVKSVPVAGYSQGFEWGSSGMVSPPGANADYVRLAGDVRANSLVAICMAWLRRNVPQGRLCIGETWESSGEREALDVHPLLAILRTPNPVWSWRSTVAAIACDLAIDGNAFAIKARTGFGDFRELWYCPSNQIQVEPDTRPDAVHPIKCYWVASMGRRTKYDPADVIHFRDGIDPARPWMGLSAFKAQLRNIVGLNAAETYTSAVLRKGHAGTVLVPRESVPVGPTADDPSPEEDELRAEKRRIAHAISGESSGGIYATTIPLDKLDVGMGPEEILLDRILDRPETMVVAAFGLNALALGLPSSRDTRTFTNLAEGIRDAWRNGVIPMQDLIAEDLTNQGLRARTEGGQIEPEFGDGDEIECWWDRSKVEALQEDASERATRAVTLFSSGIMPQNLALAAGGFDPVDGGDERYVGDPPALPAPTVRNEDDAEDDPRGVPRETPRADGEDGGSEDDAT